VSVRTVRSLLEHAPATVDVRSTLSEVAGVLRRRGGDAVAVVREGRFVGLVLARDLAAARPSAATTLDVREAARALGRMPVTAIMRADVATVIPETPLAEVARLVRDTGVPVVVLAGDTLVGVVGAGALLALLERAPAAEG